MKQALTQMKATCFHFVNGEKKVGAPNALRGNVSGLRGDVNGLWGDVSGLWGDVDDCELNDAERESGVNVSDLIAPHGKRITNYPISGASA